MYVCILYVYVCIRGLDGMSLPDVLLRLEGKSSIVEFAFSSATPEKHVALVRTQNSHVHKHWFSRAHLH